MKRTAHSAQRTAILYLLGFCFLTINLLGCDAFVRKFTRKPKKDRLQREEVIVAPQEYREAKLSNEDLYRQYFLFWNSWQEELIVSLSVDANRKKQISCAAEAIKNLLELNKLLKEEKQKRLDMYISQMAGLKESIESDLFGTGYANNRLAAERIKRGIVREFSYNKISEAISYEE